LYNFFLTFLGKTAFYYSFRIMKTLAPKLFQIILSVFLWGVKLAGKFVGYILLTLHTGRIKPPLPMAWLKEVKLETVILLSNGFLWLYYVVTVTEAQIFHCVKVTLSPKHFTWQYCTWGQNMLGATLHLTIKSMRGLSQ
jgi:hypothetical protein